ncbi:MAG: succinylglutamate desuccinylase/aspartoacylase family protein [Candidatus Nanohalobium sp.]
MEKGPGEPEIAVVAAVHGDEVCGSKAVERFLEGNFKLEKPVKFIVANEEAREQGERFIDTDLNRCFPGDPESNSHEERLAAKLMEELEGLKSLTIHSMTEFDEAFCLVNTVDEDLVTAPGVDRAVDVAPLDKDSVEKYLDAVSVEVGEVGTEEAEENAYEVLLNFLACFGAIDREKPVERPEIFEMYEAVPGNYEFLAQNFEKVEKGEKYAENEDEELNAEEAFYPVLMSTDGYDEILGFRGRKPENELKGER